MILIPFANKYLHHNSDCILLCLNTPHLSLDFEHCSTNNLTFWPIQNSCCYSPLVLAISYWFFQKYLLILDILECFLPFCLAISLNYLIYLIFSLLILKQVFSFTPFLLPPHLNHCCYYFLHHLPIHPLHFTNLST